MTAGQDYKVDDRATAFNGVRILIFWQAGDRFRDDADAVGEMGKIEVQLGCPCMRPPDMPGHLDLVMPQVPTFNLQLATNDIKMAQMEPVAGTGHSFCSNALEMGLYGGEEKIIGWHETRLFGGVDETIQDGRPS